jgi:predicted nuclease with TOPRIM domain
MHFEKEMIFKEESLKQELNYKVKEIEHVKYELLKMQSEVNVREEEVITLRTEKSRL